MAIRLPEYLGVDRVFLDKPQQFVWAAPHIFINPIAARN